ncbi:PucR family transcriptional regulator [Salinithrix halophila]|uniref:PucR family transcriptional regulator n=1 Tax=Salinithrix halophila TaxID=1485204 RepID=A0ABV8JFW2_9BACL
MGKHRRQQLRKINKVLGGKALLRPAREGERGIRVQGPEGEDNITWDGSLTPQEEALVRLLLHEEREERPPSPLRLLEQWVKLTAEGEESPLPAPAEALFGEGRLPCLLIHRSVKTDLEGIVQSYFDQEAWILSLGSREQLVLVPPRLLQGEEGEEGNSLWKEAAEGLVEAVASEAGEEVTAVTHPLVKAAGALPSVLVSLRETYRIGRLFFPDQSVHAVLDLSVERLLAALDMDRIDRFLAEVARLPFWEDRELSRTLEVFLAQNLNLSETARRLYIHRNTLIYRLDRLKQETELDPRRLEDAFKIHLALLLARRRCVSDEDSSYSAD